MGMTAGKGIVHGEMFPLVNSDKPNYLQFFQLWLNLPRAKKMVDPSFAMFWSRDVPKWTSSDGLSTVTVFAGNYFLNKETKQNIPPPDSWATNPDNDVAVLRIVVKPGGKMVLPRAKKGAQGVNRTIYLLDGMDGVEIDGDVVKEKVCITLDATKDVSIELPGEARDTSEFLVLQGRPIDEPVVSYGPFVMNTEREIREAFSDYESTQFGGWPWRRDDMIFPAKKGRFALLDGKETFATESRNQSDFEDESKSSDNEL